MKQDTDRLLVLAGQGDRTAMGELYRMYKPRVASFFRRMQVDSGRVDDLTQDVFLRVWKNAGRYRPSGKFAPFLFTVAANVWRDHLRRSRVRNRVETTGDYDHIAGKSSQHPDRAGIRSEFRHDLDDALDRLPESERMAFVLSEIEELSYRETAVAMGSRIGTVGTRKARAIRKLRRMLVKHAPVRVVKEGTPDEVSEPETSPIVR